jgi:pyruvate/2-oxoglutarate/acetoin dehydrogenase E1 component
VLESLNLGLRKALQEDRNVILLGEDILDPYGGSFKVTRGLSTLFPDQVWTTPISEAGITGIAGGMALRGMRPVVEIMFGDFTTLIADQVINHITKFGAMYYPQQDPVSVVIRTPMGGRRGYGPTHSQSLEKLFLGVPGLTVIAPFHFKGETHPGTPGELLFKTITTLNSPALFVENKLQYLLKLLSPDDMIEYENSIVHTSAAPGYPFYRLTLHSAPAAQLTLASYGYMAHLAMNAMKRLAYDHEVFCDLLVPTCLAPFHLEPLFESVRHTGRLLTIEEGTLPLGWGAEVIARTSEALGGTLKQSARLAASGIVIPAAPDLEVASLPDTEDIIKKVLEMV